LKSHCLNAILHRHKRRHGCFTGSGTSAIVYGLKALGLKNKRIAIPANVCINVPLAVYYSKNIPVFVDIDLDHLGISINELNKTSVDAIIAVHAFGVPTNIIELCEFATQQNIPIIEDACLVQGHQINHQELGQFGDISILSFGAGKVINIGGGGCILTNNKTLHENIINEMKTHHQQQRPKGFDSEDELSHEFTTLYNNVVFKNHSKYDSQFISKSINSFNVFSHKFNDDTASLLSEKFKNLDNEIQKRFENYALLEQAMIDFSHPNIQILNSKFGKSLWRFNILVESNRDQLLKKGLALGLKISSWQPTMSKYFNSESESPISDLIDQQVLNFWIDPAIKNYNEYINSCISMLKCELK
tara:strand:- start:651 stop:1730 length:1080 start_codon:yes stop_codon:yes gene_type:complete